MKILITGTSGIIGSEVAKRFAKETEVIGIDLYPSKYTTHIGDINDSSFIDKIMIDVHSVVHCAALHAPHIGVADDSKFYKVNIKGTEILLNKALSYNVSCFIYTSTTSVYGCTTRNKTEAIWVTEELKPNPEDIYDTTKLAAEKLCEKASQSGLNSIVLRVSRCFPEPDYLQVFYRLYRGVSVSDVAEAHFLSVHS